MQGWDSIHQKFRDIENRINYDDLGHALRNTKVDPLDRLATQLCIDESTVECDIKALTAEQMSLTENIGQTLEEYRRLQSCSANMETEWRALQTSVKNLEKKKREFLENLQTSRRQITDQIQQAKYRLGKVCGELDCEQSGKIDQINDIFCQILVLRAGQLVQCKFLEDLVEKKPGVLAKFKEQLKCKRKKLMKLQVHKEEEVVQEVCNLQRHNAEKHLRKQLKERETRLSRDELERIRQQKCAMDGLVRSYTEEMYKATEMASEIIQMRRFFQSLHRSAKSDSPVSVCNNPKTVEAWEKAAEIQKMQQDLSYYYQQNFEFQSELTRLLLDQQLLAVALDADTRPTRQASYNEVIHYQPGDGPYCESVRQNHRSSPSSRSPRSGSHAGDRYGDFSESPACSKHVRDSKRSSPRSSFDTERSSLAKTESGGFLTRRDDESAETRRAKSPHGGRMKIKCHLSKDHKGKPKVSCNIVHSGQTLKRQENEQPFAKVASFLQSEPDTYQPPSPPQRSPHRRAVRVRPALTLPNLICQCPASGTGKDRKINCHCGRSPGQQNQPIPDPHSDSKNPDPSGCRYDRGSSRPNSPKHPTFDSDEERAIVENPFRSGSSRKKPKVTYCECCDKEHGENIACACKIKTQQRSRSRGIKSPLKPGHDSRYNLHAVHGVLNLPTWGDVTDNTNSKKDKDYFAKLAVAGDREALMNMLTPRDDYQTENDSILITLF